LKRVQFGEFVLDVDTRELLCRGEPRAISLKAFELLHVLIEHQPKVLSKAELHDYLWPNTFVVEANLSNLIGEIRRAVGENPQHPRYVRTVHRIGYAFRGRIARGWPR
jgi:DNA-binding winged helix-turn-helix (wHTH) protein